MSAAVRAIALLVLLAGLFNVTAALKYPAPGPCKGVCRNIQDFSIIQDDNGKYYRFSGHHGIEIATSDSLIGPWTNSTPAFPCWRSCLKHLKPQLQDLWAPDVRKIGDTYYLFFTIEDFGTDIYGAGNVASAKYGQTVVATSKSLRGGTWTVRNTLNIPLRGPEYTRFDTSLLIDDNSIYMSFGSYSWGLFGIRMKSPPLQVLSQTTTMLVADEPAPALQGPQNKTEGSYLYKHNGFYYIFYASGDCCLTLRNGPPDSGYQPGAEYKIKYCRGRAVHGPYYAKDGTNCRSGQGGTKLLATHGDSVFSPGSPSIFHDPKHGLVMIYQYMNPATTGLSEDNILMGWNPLSFEDDWPVLHEVLHATPKAESTPALLARESGEAWWERNGLNALGFGTKTILDTFGTPHRSLGSILATAAELFASGFEVEPYPPITRSVPVSTSSASTTWSVPGSGQSLTVLLLTTLWVMCITPRFLAL
jgi:arabinan endo-1,5-alpha-L-arabinosidase